MTLPEQVTALETGNTALILLAAHILAAVSADSHASCKEDSVLFGSGKLLFRLQKEFSYYFFIKISV